MYCKTYNFANKENSLLRARKNISKSHLTLFLFTELRFSYHHQFLNISDTSSTV